MSNHQELRHRDVTTSINQFSNEKTANGGLNGSSGGNHNNVDDEEVDRCIKLEENCTKCCIPCLTSHNPLPENASCGEKLMDAFRLPPHGKIASYLQFFVVCLQIWIVLYTLTHQEALPGGNFYSLLILFVCCVIGGYFISFVNLPPLLGMLIVGLLLRNVPGINSIGENINVKWSGTLRKVALTVILTRAGLGLDVVKLKKLSWAVLRLAFLPCAAEIVTAGIVSKFLLGFPWLWSLMLGCIMGALSPAVTVPSLVNLQDRRYGVAKGIPTMLLAAGGLDNVFCVTGFSVFMGIIFSDGDLVVTIFKGPIGVCVGIAYGFIAGIFLWYIPAKDCNNTTFYRSLMLICAGLIAVFGSSEIGLSGAGPLGCLTTATVAAYKWRKQRQPGETDEVAGVIALAWLIVQHFLFGLIGSAVDVNNIKSNTAGMGIATLAVGLVVRSLVSFNVTMGTGFNIKERVFVTLTWLSKATVQAAIGGLALDKVLESENPNEDEVNYATDILTISVLAIIICAPVGASLMAILGPRFLEKGDEEEVEVKINKEITDAMETNDDKLEVVTETEAVEEKTKPVENHQFKSELSMTLRNLATKLEERESILDYTTGQNGGIDNPAFAEAEVDLDENCANINKEYVNETVKNEEADNVDNETVEVENGSVDVNIEPLKFENEPIKVAYEAFRNDNEVKQVEIEADMIDVKDNSSLQNTEDSLLTLGHVDIVKSEPQLPDERTEIEVNNSNSAQENGILDSEESKTTDVDDVQTEEENKSGKYVTVLQVPVYSNTVINNTDLS
ncbi:Sodium/hydrogen exchanger 9B2 [Mactra antiquata]